LLAAVAAATFIGQAEAEIGAAFALLALILFGLFAAAPSIETWNGQQAVKLHAAVRAKEAEEAAAAQARAVAFADRLVHALKPFGQNTRAELDALRLELGAAHLPSDREAIARTALDESVQALDFLATRTEVGFPPVETTLGPDDRPCFFQGPVGVESHGLHGRGLLSVLGNRLLYVGDDLRRIEWPLNTVRRAAGHSNEATLELTNRQTPIVISFRDSFDVFRMLTILAWRSADTGMTVNGAKGSSRVVES
jgi:hypothetical protein